MGEPLDFRCSLPTRWLPRVLGGSVLAAATANALALPAGAAGLGFGVRSLVGVVGALAALAAVRGGAELQMSYGLRDDALEVSTRRGTVRLRLSEVTEIDWAPPFARRGSWLPAMELTTEAGRWRIPALLDGAGMLLRLMLDRAGSDELRSWVDARRIETRLRRRSIWLSCGYLVAGLFLAAAVEASIR